MSPDPRSLPVRSQGGRESLRQAQRPEALGSTHLRSASGESCESGFQRLDPRGRWTIEEGQRRRTTPQGPISHSRTETPASTTATCSPSRAQRARPGRSFVIDVHPSFGINPPGPTTTERGDLRAQGRHERRRRRRRRLPYALFRGERRAVRDGSPHRAAPTQPASETAATSSCRARPSRPARTRG